MTPEGKRKFNTLMGSSFILLGLAAWGLTGYLFFVPAAPKPHPVSLAPEVNLGACRGALQQMGYRVMPVGPKTLRVSEEGLVDAQTRLDRATSAIALCRLPLVDFCMGTDCSSSGVVFTIGETPAAAPARPGAAGAQAQDKTEAGATPPARPERPERPARPARPPAGGAAERPPARAS